MCKQKETREQRGVEEDGGRAVRKQHIDGNALVNPLLYVLHFKVIFKICKKETEAQKAFLINQQIPEASGGVRRIRRVRKTNVPTADGIL